MKNLSLIGLLALLLVSACKKDDDRTLAYSLNTPFLLAFDQTATCNCGAPAIALVNIEDSRCPRLVECFWEGEVIVTLDLDGVLLELGISPNEGVSRNGIIDGYNIKLLEVTPYPETDNNIPLNKYQVKLEVEKL